MDQILVTYSNKWFENYTVEASYEANKTLSIPQQQQQNNETEQPKVEKALTWVTKPNPRSSFLTKTYIKHGRTVYIIQTS